MSQQGRDRLTRDEAKRRKAQLSDIRYRLDLDLEEQAKTFAGEVTVSFQSHGGDTFLEWLGGDIEALEINGVATEPEHDGYRLSLRAAALEAENEVRIRYRRAYDKTGEGFHHFVDHEDGREYLYTQFEPYSCHRLFPCFDQPDLKAVYDLSVTAPESWLITGPSRIVDSESVAGDRTRRVFETTKPFSTYLMSVVAGAYAGVESEHDGIPLGLYTRRSLVTHLEKDAEELFALTGRGMDFYKELFAEKYPFTKYDQIFVPEFNWGGMENVGNVTYTDSVVFRDPPTSDQVRRRAEYFMHELAHMWFGDLVTMKWWEDLWLNESFASYVAYLCLADLGDEEVWQDFNYRMKVWAYAEDQRPTTHQIADDVASTDETFLNFDGITYGKGAASLKQLVRAIGLDAFKDGLQTYFRRHRFDNATLADFLAALQEGSGVDLVGWAARWLRTPSLNTLTASVVSSGDTITKMTLRQDAPEDYPHLRPHHLDIAVIDRAGKRHAVPAEIDDVLVEVAEAEGLPAPAFVYPNLGDHAYAKIALDPESVRFAEDRLGEIDDILLRQQVWASLGEMVRDGQLSSLRYLRLVEQHLPSETSLPIIQMVTRVLTGVVARFVPEERIDEAAASFVATARQAIDGAPEGDPRVLWARALVSLALSEDDARLAGTLIDSPPEGLAIDQDLRWSVAVRWASLGLDGADERLDQERERDGSDRGDRALVTARSSRPDAEIKQEVWDRLHGDGYESLHLTVAAQAGFWRRTQADIVEPFVDAYFDGIAERVDGMEVEVGKSYVKNFFPRHRIDEDMRARIASVLENQDPGPVLRRMLVEEDDDIARALRCRAVAAAEAG